MISYIAVLLHKNNIITLSLWLCLFFSFLFSWLHYDRVISLRKQDWYWILTKLLTFFFDQYQHLGNCPPTPPLTQQQVRGGLWGSCPDIDIDPFCFTFFLLIFQESLVLAEIGRQRSLRPTLNLKIIQRWRTSNNRFGSKR